MYSMQVRLAMKRRFQMQMGEIPTLAITTIAAIFQALIIGKSRGRADWRQTRRLFDNGAGQQPYVASGQEADMFPFIPQALSTSKCPRTPRDSSVAEE